MDYKTGSAPPAEFEARALFQMKFYALVLWRAQGRLPRLLQLMYLGNGEIVRYEPDEADLRATERKIEALWQAIERARQSRDWRPRPGPAVRLVRAQGALPGLRRHPARPAREEDLPSAASGELAAGPALVGDDLVSRATGPPDLALAPGLSRMPLSGCCAAAGCRRRPRGRRRPQEPCSWPA